MVTQARLKELLTYDAKAGVFAWKAPTPQRLSRNGVYPYRQIRVDGRAYLVHRLAWLYCHGEFPDGYIDHVDGNPRNNSISNLRLATQSENLANKKISKSNKCGVKGVYKHRKKYRARIRKNGVVIHVGVFKTADEAGAAYFAKAQELYGEFARAA